MPLFIRVGLIFTLSAFIISSLLTRLPDVMAALDLDKATTGLALFGAPVGSLLAAPFIGRLIERRTVGQVAIVSAVALSLSLAVCGVVGDWRLLFAALFFAGIVNAFLEVAGNACADLVEKGRGVKIMSRVHGMWSIGFMLGALTAGAFAGGGVSYPVHLLVVSIAGAGLAILIGRSMPAEAFAPHVQAEDAEPAPHFALPNRHTIGVCLMAVGITLAEGAVYDWGTLYLRDEVGASPFWASIGYATFMATMAIGRMFGDKLRERFEGPALMRWSAVLAGVGHVCFVLAPSLWVAGLGLAVMGFGVALAFPLAVSAVARRPGSPAANVASLSLSVMAALLVAPPAIGFIGHAVGLQTAFILLIPLVAMSGLLAGQAAPRARATGPLSPTAGTA